MPPKVSMSSISPLTEEQFIQRFKEDWANNRQFTCVPNDPQKMTESEFKAQYDACMSCVPDVRPNMSQDEFDRAEEACMLPAEAERRRNRREQAKIERAKRDAKDKQDMADIMSGKSPTFTITDPKGNKTVLRNTPFLRMLLQGKATLPPWVTDMPAFLKFGQMTGFLADTYVPLISTDPSRTVGTAGMYGNAKPTQRVEFEPPPLKFKAGTYLQSPYGNTNAAQNTVFVTPAPLKETGGRPGVVQIPK